MAGTLVDKTVTQDIGRCFDCQVLLCSAPQQVLDTQVKARGGETKLRLVERK
jgi:hypothetical protein